MLFEVTVDLRNLSTVEELLVELVRGNTSATEKLVERVTVIERKAESLCENQTSVVSSVTEVKLRVDDIWRILRSLFIKVILVCGSVCAISFVLGYLLKG